MNFRCKGVARLPEVQFTSLIDVVFLLLCFFITTSVFSQWEYEIDISLPSAQSGKVPDRLPGEIIINIAKDGRVSVNQQDLTLDAIAERAGFRHSQYMAEAFKKRQAHSALADVHESIDELAYYRANFIRLDD